MNIGIIGNGVVGSATAKAFGACCAVYDSNPARSPNTLEQALLCDLIVLCLPTPSLADGSCDASAIYSFIGDVPSRCRNENFVLRSTVNVGYTKYLYDIFGLTNLVHWPEFLTARTAEVDAANPVRNVIGYPSDTTANPLREVIERRWSEVPMFEMFSDSSETVKLAQNAFSAVKIAFFNELREFTDARGLNWDNIMSALLAGGWINRMHTDVPGPDGKRGFGGACLPKDLDNLIACMVAEEKGLYPFVCEAAAIRNVKDRGGEQ